MFCINRLRSRLRRDARPDPNLGFRTVESKAIPVRGLRLSARAKFRNQRSTRRLRGFRRMQNAFRTRRLSSAHPFLTPATELYVGGERLPKEPDRSSSFAYPPKPPKFVKSPTIALAAKFCRLAGCRALLRVSPQESELGRQSYEKT